MKSFSAAIDIDASPDGIWPSSLILQAGPRWGDMFDTLASMPEISTAHA